MTLFAPQAMTQAERTWNRLWNILYARTRHHHVYVYRLTSDGYPVDSYIWRGPATPELPGILGDEFLGGDFRVLIRRNRVMVFGGNISIETPRGSCTGYPTATIYSYANGPNRPEKDTRLERDTSILNTSSALSLAYSVLEHHQESRLYHPKD